MAHKANILAGATNIDTILAGLDLPPVMFCTVVFKSRMVQSKCDSLCLSGTEEDFCESLKFLGGAVQITLPCVMEPDVELGNLRGIHSAAIRHSKGDGESIRLVHFRPVKLQVVVVKVHIAEAMTKGILDTDTRFLIVAIPRVDALPILNPILLVRLEIGTSGDIILRERPGLCQFAAGRDFAEQDIGQRLPCALAEQTGI